MNKLNRHYSLPLRTARTNAYDYDNTIQHMSRYPQDKIITGTTEHASNTEGEISKLRTDIIEIRSQ